MEGTGVVTMQQVQERWEGHRRLTRKVIEAFPEEKLFTFSIGGMRTFGEMAGELLGMAVPVVDGLTSGAWEQFAEARPGTKAELLAAWEKTTAELKAKVPGIPREVLAATHKAFGQWEMTGLTLLEYAIDNEIHHRGEGYVYLRALGVEPPAFWDRY